MKKDKIKEMTDKIINKVVKKPIEDLRYLSIRDLTIEQRKMFYEDVLIRWNKEDADEIYIPKEVNEHHRYLNVWILNKNKNYFYRKESSEGAEMVGRERYIQDIEKALKKKPDRWATESDIKDPAFRKIVVLWKRGWIPWKGKVPAISIKTGDGIRTHARPHDKHSKVLKLPYWGKIEKVKEIFDD